jgi:hypothetical protein
MINLRSLANAGRLMPCALALLCSLTLFTSSRIVRADGDAGGKDLQLIKPLTGATVREKVPVSIAKAALPDGGYASISIDDTFIEAVPVPDNGDQLYDWDTKAPYSLPNDPDKKLLVQDGNHTIAVTIYNRDNTVFGTANATVRVANAIPELKDGVTLRYKWGNFSAKYSQKFHLEQLNSSSGLPPTTIQKSNVVFARQIEDQHSSTAEISDKALSGGTVTLKGVDSYVQSIYNLLPKEREIKTDGVVLTTTRSTRIGDHYGFLVASLPSRRVQVGDSWQVPIEFSLTWANDKTSQIQGTARLDSFEWQDHYPCAKIVESYNGNATLFIPQPSSQTPQQINIGGSATANQVPPITGAIVHLTRTLWFAYEAGILVHVSTDATVNASVTSNQAAALGGDVTGGSNPIPDNGGQINPFTPGGYAQPSGNAGGNAQASAPLSFHVSEEIVRGLVK